MNELMSIFLEAAAFCAALMGGGWLCIVLGEKLGVQ